MQTQHLTLAIGRWLIACVLLGSGIFSSLPAQNSAIPRVSLFIDYAELNGVDAEEKQIYTDVARDKLSQLVYASSFGNAAGKWDGDRYLLFSRLFTNDALITHFLQLKPSSMPAYNFLAMADESINPRAINFKHKTAMMRSMRKNPSGDIEVSIQLDWEVFSYFDKKGQWVESVKGRPTMLHATLIIDPADPSSAVFISMTGETVSSLSNDLSSLSVTAAFQSGSLSTMNDFGFMGVKPVVQGFGLHLQYNKNLGSGQKWFLWGGLQAAAITTRTDFAGKVNPVGTLDPVLLDSSILRIGIDKNSGKLDSSKVNGILFATSEAADGTSEEILRNSIVLQGVLGIQRRWTLSNNWDAYAGIGLSTQYLFANSNGTRNIQGYKLPAGPDGKTVVTNFPAFTEINSQGIGSAYRLVEEDQLDGIGHKGNLSLNAVLQGSLRRTLGFGWGIEVAAQYQLGMGNMFFYSGGPEINFPGKASDKKTLLEDYAPNTRFQGWGVSVGLFFEFGTKY